MGSGGTLVFRGRRAARAASCWWRFVVVAVVAAAVVALLPAAPGSASTTAAVAGERLWGVSTPSGPWDLGELVDVERAVGKQAGMTMWAQDFAHHPNFDTRLVDGVLDQGAWPVLTWAPWDDSGGRDQPHYALSRIVDGSHDAHIRRWASQIAAWNRPLMLRFAHEMNGNWYPWSAGANGNRPGQFVAAWRHVHDIFRQAGATNVKWIWSVSVVYDQASTVAGLYPGDAYVDYAGVDGYNWGTTNGKTWQSFESVFGGTISAVRGLTGKPVLLTEVGSAEQGGSKAAWIADFFNRLRSRPEIAGFIWTNHRWSQDWQIGSSPTAQAAFAQGVADARYADGATFMATAPRQPRALLGASTPGGPWNFTDLDAFEAAAGRRVGLFMWYQDFAHYPDFDPRLPQAVLDRGAVPMLTWDPWDSSGPVDQPRYSLARIIDGSHDGHIRRWASQIAAWNKPLMLRFAHEMNGSWNSWSEGVNGNRPGEFVRAWRHVHGLFEAAGASNVTWVWSPNVVYSNSPPLAPYYPGDDYVDRVGMDGYNWGDHFAHWKAWMSFEQIFGPTIAQAQALTSKPLLVAETASTEGGGNKAAWIADMFAALARHPEITGVVWFNHHKETDWRIQSSAEAEAAFRLGAASARFAPG